MKNNHTKNQSLNQDQQGLVAIIVTTMVLIVLSLIVLAFSQAARREQRQSLDRQLSSQAYYAAEAGINKTVDQIRKNIITDTQKTTCDPTVQAADILDKTNSISYSCVLYNRAPTELKFGSVGTESSEVVSLAVDPAAPLSEITIEWRNSNDTARSSGCAPISAFTSLPTSGAYGANCDAGMLQIMLISATNPLTQDNLYNNSFMSYLRPARSGSGTGTISFVPHSAGPNTQGLITPAACPNNTGCKTRITGLAGKSPLYLQMKSIYKVNKVSITGLTTSGTAARFIDSQIEVDVTGRANDVLRRVKVNVPFKDPSQLPGFAIESMGGICKQLGVDPSGVSSSSGPSGCLGNAYFN
jgi:hypothetical protein